MKKNITGCLILLLSTFLLADAGVNIPANDPLIEYTGRIDFKDPLAPKFSYSGVSIRAAFQGKSISVKLKDEGNQNFYNVIIDHSVVSRLQTVAGLQTYVLSSTLADTIHEIELFRLTEQTFGKTQFYGFVVDDGKTLVELSDKRPRLMEFIGNSITCGYGNEGVNGGKFGPTTENHYLTYAGFTSRSFNARHLGVCKSGIGIYRNYGAPMEGSPDNMTDYYQRIFLYDATPLYDFAQKPDLICIDLGTNDFSTSQGDSARYVSKYFQLITTLQAKNNGADILCLLGPMMGGNDLIRVRKYLTFIADSATRRNNGKVYFFEMSAQTGSLGIGIDWHPTVAQHLQNSRELSAYISKLKGWGITAYAISATTTNADELVLTFNTPVQDLTNSFSGFTVTDETSGAVPISKTFIDAVDKSKIHLLLSKNLSSKSVIKVTYARGSFESLSREKMKEFNLMPVTNTLTETLMTKASVDATGTKVTLTFNKNISLPASSSVITLLNNQNQSFTIKNMSKPTASTLQFILNEKVTKGDSLFINAEASIFGTDKVEITPVKRFLVTNQSVYTDANVLKTLQCTVFPNPVNSKVINYSIQEKDHSFKARLLNLQGGIISDFALSNAQGSIDLNGLKIPAGTYLLRIYSSSKEYTTKIIL